LFGSGSVEVVQRLKKPNKPSISFRIAAVVDDMWTRRGEDDEYVAAALKDTFHMTGKAGEAAEVYIYIYICC
jgi:hypothetical protein